MVVIVIMVRVGGRVRVGVGVTVIRLDGNTPGHWTRYIARRSGKTRTVPKRICDTSSKQGL